MNCWFHDDNEDDCMIYSGTKCCHENLNGENMKDQKRNLNPTPETKVAMIMFGDKYAAQKGGSMDFWDQLSAITKNRCILVVKELTNKT